jgi:protein SCO1/2/putative membrane protein
MSAPDWVLTLPAVNAGLNALATVLLLAGYRAIKRQQQLRHQRLMVAAFIVSTVFLGCYLTYHAGLHYYTGEAGRKFTGTGPVRPIYFGILISHVLLAMAIAVLAPVTLYRGYRAQWAAHRRIARITFPLWVYVSITGVVIYMMLYHWPVSPAV